MDNLDSLVFKQTIHDILGFLESVDNILVVIGALYASKVFINSLYRIYRSIWTYVVPRLWYSKDLAKDYGGKWAVVTGASEGIGRSYALKLAERNMNIFMISRTEAKLTALADEIKEKHGSDINTICFPLDMAHLGDDEVYARLKEALDQLDVGVLVNNVGLMFDRLQYFLTVPKRIQQGVIDLNMTALVHLTQIVLPQMVGRGKGAIINIGSGASVKPTPLMSTYSASKQFVDSFSSVLQYEYADKGITVQCIQPFYVSTNMTHHARPNLMITHPNTYVESSLCTLGFSNRNYGYWSHGLFGYLGEWLPERFYMFCATNINSHLWSWLTGVNVDNKKKV